MFSHLFLDTPPFRVFSVLTEEMIAIPLNIFEMIINFLSRFQEQNHYAPRSRLSHVGRIQEFYHCKFITAYLVGKGRVSVDC